MQEGGIFHEVEQKNISAIGNNTYAGERNGGDCARSYLSYIIRQVCVC